MNSQNSYELMKISLTNQFANDFGPDVSNYPAIDNNQQHMPDTVVAGTFGIRLMPGENVKQKGVDGISLKDTRGQHSLSLLQHSSEKNDIGLASIESV